MRLSPTLGFGVFLVLLALVTATGAVSIGQTGTGTSVITGLVYSPLFMILSIVLAVAGMTLIYLAGRNDARPSQHAATSAKCF